MVTQGPTNTAAPWVDPPKGSTEKGKTKHLGVEPYTPSNRYTFDIHLGRLENFCVAVIIVKIWLPLRTNSLPENFCAEKSYDSAAVHIFFKMYLPLMYSLQRLGCYQDWLGFSLASSTVPHMRCLCVLDCVQEMAGVHSAATSFTWLMSLALTHGQRKKKCHDALTLWRTRRDPPTGQMESRIPA